MKFIPSILLLIEVGNLWPLIASCEMDEKLIILVEKKVMEGTNWNFKKIFIKDLLFSLWGKSQLWWEF